MASDARPWIIAIANHKGGVGKTTTTHTLGAVLSEDYGLRVGMIDCDPQSSLTEACGIPDANGRSMADILGNAKARPSIGDILRPIGESGRLWLAPSSLDLAAAQRDLSSRLVGRDSALKRELSNVSGLDGILIDCPPTLDLLTLNALVAADFVIIPTKPQIVDLRGLRLFLQTLDDVRFINEHLRVMGVLITFWQNYNLHKRAQAALERLGLPLFETKIGVSVRVAEGPEISMSVVDYAPRNDRAAEYRALTAEVLSLANTGSDNG